MNLLGKRKFIAFLISVSVYLLLMILPMIRWESDYTGLANYALQLGIGMMTVSGALYAGNAISNRNRGENK